jgi:hypothetical protein
LQMAHNTDDAAPTLWQMLRNDLVFGSFFSTLPLVMIPTTLLAHALGFSYPSRPFLGGGFGLVLWMIAGKLVADRRGPLVEPFDRFRVRARERRSLGVSFDSMSFREKLLQGLLFVPLIFLLISPAAFLMKLQQIRPQSFVYVPAEVMVLAWIAIMPPAFLVGLRLSRYVAVKVFERR